MVPCTEIQNYSSKAERRPRRGAVSLMGGMVFSKQNRKAWKLSARERKRLKIG